ncbi:hypothetical protein ACSNOK_22270 [Streptomyces sp. URMC 126]|uniref:hypothetical protein n=1 Tax=Streptomyces sp. URMC 126 TaxID=3423401 RepID=UPI003F1A0875
MTGSALPLLFLDVDGPLIPFGATDRQLPGGYPTYLSPWIAPGTTGDGGNPLIARIDPALGPRLAALPYELVWATTWMSDANDCVAPWLGLPPLPVVVRPEPTDEPDPSETPDEVGVVAVGAPARRAVPHWKTRALVEWADGRPFAWVDDEIGDADRRWVRAHHPVGALLHRVDPLRGLRDGDFAALDAWSRSTRST